MRVSLRWLRGVGALLVGLLLVETVALQSVQAATWEDDQPLSLGRGDHTATLLADGRVLIVGGQTSASAPNTALNRATIYNSQSRTWSEGATMSTSRSGHTATLLPDGRVLIIGGENVPGGSTSLRPAEIYNPTSNAWTLTSGTAGRAHHTATPLPDGRVLVVGGESSQGGSLTSLANAEIYDPATNAWTPAGSLATSRAGHIATILPSGQVLIAGGATVGPNGATILSSSEIYTPATNSWSAGQSLASARSNFTATKQNDNQVLVAGGDANCLAMGERYNPTTNRWVPTGDLSVSRAGHSATLLGDGRVLVVGGDLTRAGTSFGPSNVGALSVRSALLPALGTTEIFNPITNTWTTYDPLQQARYGHTATLLPDGRVLVVGGFDDGGTGLSSVESSQPQTPAATTTPQQSAAPSAAPTAPPSAPPPPPPPPPSSPPPATADFSLAAQPDSLTITAGGTVAYALTVARTNFTTPVNLSVAGLPAGATATFGSNPAGANSLLTVVTAANTPAGTYPLTITGTGGGLTRTTTATLIVLAPALPSPSPAASPSPSASATPSPTATLTPTATQTQTPTPEPEPEEEPDPPTATPTRTPTRTPTSTPTSTPTTLPTNTPTNTPSPTLTLVPPTITPTNPTGGPTATLTVPPDGSPTTFNRPNRPILAAHSTLNQGADQGSGGLAESHNLAAGLLDCPARSTGLPSTGGGWAANQRGLEPPTLLVLALLALGTGALANWGWRRRVRAIKRPRD